MRGQRGYIASKNEAGGAVSVSYAVALNYGGLSALICDASPQGALREGPGRLSSGVLFPGCIFAYAGDGEAARRFLGGGVEWVQSVETRTVRWRHFHRFARSYKNEEPEKRFQVLLSERSEGTPTTYLFDSRSGLHGPWQDGCFTIGSGRGALDRTTREHVEDLTHSSESMTPESPYALCLRLTAAAQPRSAEEFERTGLGGGFHFLLQDAESELPQSPAVYVIVRGELTTPFMFRTAFRLGYSRQGLSLDRWRMTNERALERLGRSIFRPTSFACAIPIPRQPFYHVLGVASADPSIPGWDMLSRGDSPDFTKDGSISQRVQNAIDSVVADFPPEF